MKIGRKNQKMRIGRIGEIEGTTNLSYLMHQDKDGRMRKRLGVKNSKNTEKDAKNEIKSKEQIFKEKKEKFKKEQKQRGIKRKRLPPNMPAPNKRRKGAPTKSKLYV